MALSVVIVLAVCLTTFVLWNRSRSRTAPRLTRSQENANLVKVLLELEEEPREQLFTLYQEQFGTGAARYARQTYQKWKEGTVRPNKQTFRRFLLNLPHVMNFDLKCEVLRELREAYCARDTYEVTVTTDNWKQTLTPMVQSVFEKASTAELPQSISRRLTWLASDDVTVANAILAESQARETANALTMLEKEFSNIDELLNNMQGTGKVTHQLKLPLGTIILNIRKGKRDG